MAKQSWGAWDNIGQIGEGGAGHVYKVRHQNTGDIGALKRLKNVNRLARFKNEVEAVGRLDHPGIVRLLDHNLESEPFYAVYDYEPGGSLGELSKETLLAIPLDQRLKWCEQLCDALQAAHEAALVHRDLKPDNILLSVDRKNARLCDFGLVFWDEAGERQTATMEQIGSRYYLPPELEDGRADEVSSASDIYSMGKVLYYLVTGNVFAREVHRTAKYDLAKVLNDPYLEPISGILDETIVHNVEERVSSALAMRLLIELARKELLVRGPVRGVPETYRCVFCKTGIYTEICVSGESKCHNSGYGSDNMGGEQMVYCECNNCGNSQRFKLKYGEGRWFPNAVANVNARRR